MGLSLEIMDVRVFVLLDAGTESTTTLWETWWARPGSKNRARAQDGSARNLGDPMFTAQYTVVWSMTPNQTRPSHGASCAMERTEAMGGARARRQKLTETDVGSRSALIVPTKSGNSAQEDPVEGRGASG